MPDSISDDKVYPSEPRPLVAETERLRAANEASIKALALQRIQVDPGWALMRRIDLLAEMTLGKGPGVEQFDLRYQRMLASELERISAEAPKAMLAAAAQASPQQVQQMAAAQGLLGPDGQPIRH
jgi:hypothetical protein